MTFRTTISSKKNPRDFLKKGFKSMFPNYELEQKAAPPIDSDDEKKRPSS